MADGQREVLRHGEPYPEAFADDVEQGFVSFFRRLDDDFDRVGFKAQSTEGTTVGDGTGRKKSVISGMMGILLFG